MYPDGSKDILSFCRTIPRMLFTRRQEGEMASPAIGQAPPLQIETVAPKRRRRSRLLPVIEDRRAISLNINPSVDVKLEILTALDGKMKNEIVLASLSEFLTNKISSCDAAHESRSGFKVRVTFILTREIEEQLNTFVEHHGCTHVCAVTTALAQYCSFHYGIDLLKDHSRDKIIQAMRS